MQRLFWGALLAATLAGCAGNTVLPGHNHSEDAVVSADAPAGDGATALEIWRLKVAGAT